MYCSKCGAEIQDGTKFCAKCGAPTDGASVGTFGASSGTTGTSTTSPLTKTKNGLNWKTWLWIGAAVVGIIILIAAVSTPNYIADVKSWVINKDQGNSVPLETILDEYVHKQKWSSYKDDDAIYVECHGLLVDFEFSLKVRVTELGDDGQIFRIFGGTLDEYPMNGAEMTHVLDALCDAYENNTELIDVDDYVRWWLTGGGNYSPI